MPVQNLKTEEKVEEKKPTEKNKKSLIPEVKIPNLRGVLRPEPKEGEEGKYIEHTSALFTVLMPNMKLFTKKYDIVDKKVEIIIGGGKNYIAKEINLGDHKPYIINSGGSFGGKEMYYIDWENAKVLDDEDFESHFTYYTPEMLKKIGQSKFLRMLLKRRNLVQKPGTGGGAVVRL